MDKVKVRFAPSPTGDLHIGGVRTALFNWLFARHNEGKFVLRIEDTDQERSTQESVEQIISAMKWVGLNWDEGPDAGGDFGPYYQSERNEFYKKALDYLLEKDRAYYCYCTPEEIDQMRAEAEASGKPSLYPGRCRHLSQEEIEEFKKEGRKPTIRLKVPTEGYTLVNDLIRGEVSFENSLIGDLIIAKSDGTPTYNLACVVDDHHMEITHVIRAEEHLSNTPKQVLIYQALDYPLPEFAHVPMILAPDRSKLSKRHGATSVDEFKDLGYLPQALINYLLLLGWSPGNNEEIIPLEQAIRDFDLQDVSRTAAVYDVQKLTWMNGNYMKSLPLEEIIRQAMPFIKKAGYIPDNPTDSEIERLNKIVEVVRERSRTLVELVEGMDYFYKEIEGYDEKGVKKHFQPEDTLMVLENNLDCLEKVVPFEEAAIEAVYRQRSEELGIKTARMIHTTRLALSGKTFGPGVFTLIELVGRETAIKRLKKAIDYIRANN
jgi:glutamyl-tRNA synthetase